MMLTWSSPLEQFDAVTAATTAHGKEELKQVIIFLIVIEEKIRMNKSKCTILQ